MATTPRDRDEQGRARQARPRDALGRPLPYGEPGVEPVSEDPLPPLETIAAALALLDQGRPFAAHEVCEARWKAAPPDERDLWQGLAQLCVALTHALRGNARGAERLLGRGSGRLMAYETSAGPTYGLDLPAVRRCCADQVLRAQGAEPGRPAGDSPSDE
jgi:hypothetical protein